MLQERQSVFQPFPPSHAKPKPQTKIGRDEKSISHFSRTIDRNVCPSRSSAAKFDIATRRTSYSELASDLLKQDDR